MSVPSFAASGISVIAKKEFFLKFYEMYIKWYLNTAFKSQNIFRINTLG